MNVKSNRSNRESIKLLLIKQICLFVKVKIVTYISNTLFFDFYIMLTILLKRLKLYSISIKKFYHTHQKFKKN